LAQSGLLYSKTLIMGNRSFQPRKNQDLTIAAQKYAITSSFPGLGTCEKDRLVLIWHAKITPLAICQTYTVKIIYDGKSPPKVFVVAPKLEKSPHVYKEGNLCLYDPEETPWDYRRSIASTIIPWTIDWLVHYEIFLATGVWCAKERHPSGGSSEKTNKNS